MKTEDIICGLVAVLLLSSIYLYSTAYPKTVVHQITIYDNASCPASTERIIIQKDCSGCSQELNVTDPVCRLKLMDKLCPDKCPTTRMSHADILDRCTNVDECCITITNQDGESLTKCPQELGIIKP